MNLISILLESIGYRCIIHRQTRQQAVKNLKAKQKEAVTAPVQQHNPAESTHRKGDIDLSQAPTTAKEATRKMAEAMMRLSSTDPADSNYGDVFAHALAQVGQSMQTIHAQSPESGIPQVAKEFGQAAISMQQAMEGGDVDKAREIADEIRVLSQKVDRKADMDEHKEFVPQERFFHSSKAALRSFDIVKNYMKNSLEGKGKSYDKFVNLENKYQHGQDARALHEGGVADPKLHDSMARAGQLVEDAYKDYGKDPQSTVKSLLNAMRHIVPHEQALEQSGGQGALAAYKIATGGLAMLSEDIATGKVKGSMAHALIGHLSHLINGFRSNEGDDLYRKAMETSPETALAPPQSEAGKLVDAFEQQISNHQLPDTSAKPAEIPQAQTPPEEIPQAQPEPESAPAPAQAPRNYLPNKVQAQKTAPMRDAIASYGDAIRNAHNDLDTTQRSAVVTHFLQQALQGVDKAAQKITGNPNLNYSYQHGLFNDKGDKISKEDYQKLVDSGFFEHFLERMKEYEGQMQRMPNEYLQPILAGEPV